MKAIAGNRKLTLFTVALLLMSVFAVGMVTSSNHDSEENITIVHERDVMENDFENMDNTMDEAPAPPTNLQVQHIGGEVPAPEPGETGEYDFDVWNTDFIGPWEETVPVDIFYPTEGQAPYPALVIAHGFMMSNDHMQTWGEYYASWGYVASVIHMQYARIINSNHTRCAYELLENLKFLEEENSDSSSLIYGLVDVDNMGLTGFSLGGKASVLAAQYDVIEETYLVKAIAPMAVAIENQPDPIPGLDLLDIPVQLQAGEVDTIAPPEDNSEEVYDNLEDSPAQYFMITGANHNQYPDRNPVSGGIGDGTATITREEQHRIARKYQTAFFNYYLKGQTAYGPYLYGDVIEQDVTDEVLMFNHHKNMAPMDLMNDNSGTEHNQLTWDASLDDPADVSHYNIYSSDNLGDTYELISSVNADGSTEYSYVDWNKGTADEILWWYIVRAVGTNEVEEQNNNVAIEPSEGEEPSITLTRPDGGETFTAGDSEDITWTVTPGDDPIDTIDIRYSTDGGNSWTTIVTGIPDSSPYGWTVPNVASTECMVRIIVRDTMGRVGLDDSDSHFTIVGIPPSPPSNLIVEHVGEGIPFVLDDFSDGDYTNDPTWTVYDGDWSVEQSEGKYWLEGIGQISTPHTQAYGAWEWDFQFDRSGGGRNNQMRFYFIQDQPQPDVENCSGYYIIVVPNLIGGDPTINLWRLDNGVPPEEPLITDTWTANTDWNTLRVERDHTGVFTVYLNGDVIGSASSPDNTYTSSTHIGFRHSAGQDTDRNRVSEVRVLEANGDGTQDNLLTWDASPDDPDAVSHYNVYRSESESGPWDTVIADIDADGSSDYQYVDLGAGTADSVLWWYVVRAVGHNGMEEDNTDSVQEPAMELDTFEVQLYENADSDGWNFVSFNLIPLDSSLETLLDDIDGTYDRLMYFNAESNTWYTYIPTRPDHYNNLGNWNNRMGVWIRMTSDATLTLEGVVPVVTTLELYPGWNMVGLPSSSSGNHDLPSEVTRVGYFDAGTDYNVAYVASGGFQFHPGEGYWVYNEADQVVYWSITY